MTPVRPAERIELLDVLRGAALFGILASNMRAFHSPMHAYLDHTLMWTGGVDRVTQAIVDLLISGKFITIFAFLFGIGFAIQIDRARERGASSRFFLRRLSALLLFGLAHGFLLWFGDILLPYALMGFALYLFRNRTRKSVARWAVGLYLWPLVPVIAGAISEAAGFAIPTPPRATAEEIARIIQVYSTGTYAQIFQQHVSEMVFQAFGLLFFYPRVLGLFLAGLWVWRSGLLTNLRERAAMLRRFRTWGLAIGLAGNASMVAINEIWHVDPLGLGPIQLAMGLSQSVGVPMLSLFYVSAIALAYLESEQWRGRLRPFAAVGRTALTNYLLQTVICTSIFNSWGLGLYGRVSPTASVPLVVALYGAQVAASVWYRRRFEFGPMEWLWRVLTYGRVREPDRAATTA